MVLGLKNLDTKNINQCTSCTKKKKDKDKFPKQGRTHAKEVLNLIHSDICGQLQTSTHFGSTYFITFVDDHTHYTIIYLPRQKSNAFEKFKQYKEMVENQMNKTIKVLHANNSGEYKSLEFTK